MVVDVRQKHLLDKFSIVIFVASLSCLQDECDQWVAARAPRPRRQQVPVWTIRPTFSTMIVNIIKSSSIMILDSLIPASIYFDPTGRRATCNRRQRRRRSVSLARRRRTRWNHVRMEWTASGEPNKQVLTAIVISTEHWKHPFQEITVKRVSFSVCDLWRSFLSLDHSVSYRSDPGTSKSLTPKPKREQVLQMRELIPVSLPPASHDDSSDDDNIIVTRLWPWR